MSEKENEQQEQMASTESSLELVSDEEKTSLQKAVKDAQGALDEADALQESDVPEAEPEEASTETRSESEISAAIVEADPDSDMEAGVEPELEATSVDQGEEVSAPVQLDVDISDEQDDDYAAAALEEMDEEGEQEDLEREQEPDDDRMWYVVHCYSGYENKVCHNLEQRIETMGMKDKIFDVVVPTEEEIEIKDGKRRTVERRVFPGYILVQMIMGEDSWYVVRNTPGVTGFVGMGNEPTPLRPEEVSQIVKRMEAEAPRIKVTFKTGQKVRIIDGPFNDFIGTVSEIDMERAKVRVMVSFFGRETPVELDFLQVEKA